MKIFASKNPHQLFELSTDKKEKGNIIFSIKVYLGKRVRCGCSGLLVGWN